MHGIVTDEDGNYVKAAIVKLYKQEDSLDGSDAETITYTQSDENGNFAISDLNPDEKYVIEIHLNNTESEPNNTVLEVNEIEAEDDDTDQEEKEISSELNNGGSGIAISIVDSIQSKIDLENKLYYTKNVTWT